MLETALMSIAVGLVILSIPFILVRNPKVEFIKVESIDKNHRK